jgi:hypothetical protein
VSFPNLILSASSADISRLYSSYNAESHKPARDRFELTRHRWEAANLKWDLNITARDVPTKFGDDATDAAKQYLQTFALDAAPLTRQQQIEEAIDPRLRMAAIERQDVQPTEGWWMSRQRQLDLAEIEMNQQGESEWEAMWRDTV